MTPKTGLRHPTPQSLPYILQQLGHSPLTFFKLYAPSYRCPRCGEEGLFVKVSANDGRVLTEFWDVEGPRANFENMEGLELHQGIGAKGGFRYEEFHESGVADHLDVFGTLFVRSSRLIQALVQANLFIDRQAPRHNAKPAGPVEIEDREVRSQQSRQRVAGERAGALGQRARTQAPAQSADKPECNLELRLGNAQQAKRNLSAGAGGESRSAKPASPGGEEVGPLATSGVASHGTPNTPRAGGRVMLPGETREGVGRHLVLRTASEPPLPPKARLPAPAPQARGGEGE